MRVEEVPRTPTLDHTAPYSTHPRLHKTPLVSTRPLHPLQGASLSKTPTSNLQPPASTRPTTSHSITFDRTFDLLFDHIWSQRQHTPDDTFRLCVRFLLLGGVA
eukprot:8589618-Pyramimonas_sp.AAC.1